jgi:capsular exopolysaccharide synthesis family protein
MLQREVDRLLNFNHSLLDHIDNIDINQNQSDVRVDVVSRPHASERPVSPNAMLVAAVSLLATVSLGAGLVYVVDVLDDRFRSFDELKTQLGTPVLAMVRQLQSRGGTGLDSLQVHVAQDAVESEAFRTLRTTLAFAAGQLECAAISSAEPGDGKTTIVANLGVSIAQSGRRTLLIDADLRRPGLSRLFGIKGQTGLTELLQGESPIREACGLAIHGTGHDKLDVLPSGTRPLDPTGLLSSSRFAEVLSWAAGQYDQILVDSPPLLVASDAAIVGRMAGGLMLVVQPQKSHRRLVVRAVEEARSVGLNLIGVIVNRLTNDSGQAYYGEAYGYGYGYGSTYHDAVDQDEPASDLTVEQWIAHADQERSVWGRT